jgi:hypothetical protein
MLNEMFIADVGQDFSLMVKADRPTVKINV